MPPAITLGTMLKCSFGMAPTSLIVLPESRVFIGGKPAATIFDNKPFVNIPTFGMCQSLANPMVAAATAAALGVLTPMPCIPNTPMPWIPPSPTALLGGKPALKLGSTCMCLWGGVISITGPGEPTTQVP